MLIEEKIFPIDLHFHLVKRSKCINIVNVQRYLRLMFDVRLLAKPHLLLALHYPPSVCSMYNQYLAGNRKKDCSADIQITAISTYTYITLDTYTSACTYYLPPRTSRTDVWNSSRTRSSVYTTIARYRTYF